MKNIICNSRWCPGPDGGPLYFSGSGATYDNLCVCGYRTCTTTLPEGGSGYDQYDPAIPVRGQQAITWGYVLRAVEAQDIRLAAEFCGPNGQTERREEVITCRVCYCFSRQMATFSIPDWAETVRLSLHFAGKTTACTYYAPAAYVC